MLVTLTLDDDLLVRARNLAGITDNTSLVHVALQALIEREAAKRLVLLGGSEPGLSVPSRRRGRPI